MIGAALLERQQAPDRFNGGQARNRAKNFLGKKQKDVMLESIKELLTRALYGAVLTGVLIAVSIKGGILFLIFIDVIIALGIWEFFRLQMKKGHLPNRTLGTVLALSISWASFFLAEHYLILILTASVLLPLGAELWRKDKGSALANAGATMMGIFYVGYLGSFSILLREVGNGALDYSAAGYLVLLVFVGIWTSDTLAYLAGVALGRHKLFPEVSPQKTVEGSVAGLLGALLIGWIGSQKLGFLSLHQGLTIGIIIGVVGQVGDLVESLMKRDAQVKDSSTLIPGHGGILDRFDSYFFVFPSVYLYIRYVR